MSQFVIHSIWPQSVSSRPFSCQNPHHGQSGISDRIQLPLLWQKRQGSQDVVGFNQQVTHLIKCEHNFKKNNKLSHVIDPLVCFLLSSFFSFAYKPQCKKTTLVYSLGALSRYLSKFQTARFTIKLSETQRFRNLSTKEVSWKDSVIRDKATVSSASLLYLL